MSKYFYSYEGLITDSNKKKEISKELFFHLLKHFEGNVMQSTLEDEYNCIIDTEGGSIERLSEPNIDFYFISFVFVMKNEAIFMSVYKSGDVYIKAKPEKQVSDEMVIDKFNQINYIYKLKQKGRVL